MQTQKAEAAAPLVSVLVPSYNHAPYVRQTIESILNQTYRNIELIVVDDGSRDESPALLAAMSRQYGFRLEVQENRGVPATRNRLISLASGRYLCGCGSDDFFAPDKIEKQVAFMEANPEYGMCFGHIGYVDADGKEIVRPRRFLMGGWIFRELLTKRMTIPALTHMVRREVFEAVGPYDETIAVEDWYKWLQVAERYPMGLLDEVLAYRREHGKNMSARPLFMVREHEKVLRAYEDHPFYPEARRAFDLRAFGMLAAGHKREALPYMVRSLPRLYRRSFLSSAARLVARWR